jgi:hypothetical protein
MYFSFCSCKFCFSRYVVEEEEVKPRGVRTCPSLFPNTCPIDLFLITCLQIIQETR